MPVPLIQNNQNKNTIFLSKATKLGFDLHVSTSKLELFNVISKCFGNTIIDTFTLVGINTNLQALI